MCDLGDTVYATVGLTLSFYVAGRLLMCPKTHLPPLTFPKFQHVSMPLPSSHTLTIRLPYLVADRTGSIEMGAPSTEYLKMVGVSVELLLSESDLPQPAKMMTSGCPKLPPFCKQYLRAVSLCESPLSLFPHDFDLSLYYRNPIRMIAGQKFVTALTC